MKHGLALVTGATAGIGQALCFLLAKKGIALLVTGQNKEQLDYLSQELPPHLLLTAMEADLASTEGRRKIIDLVHDYCPDLVINNAGFGLYGEGLTYQTEEQKKIIDVNATAVLELTLEAARTLVSNQQEGVILNVSSAAAFQVAPYMAVYAASKAFVMQFSLSMDEELKARGVRVLTACPGMVKTSFSKRAGQVKAATGQDAGSMTAEFVAEEIWKQIQSLKPLKVTDWKYRLLTSLSHFAPSSWAAFIIKKNIAGRIVPRNLIQRPPCIKKTNQQSQT